MESSEITKPYLSSTFAGNNGKGTALVFGKFAPFHKGHEMLIREALAQSDRVYVLAYDHPELATISTEEMAKLMRLILNDERIEIIECYNSPPAGHSEEAQQDHNQYAKAQLPEGAKIDKVFCNEWYGKHIADYFGANHIRIDPERMQYPISATQIRSNPQDHLDHLHPLVAQRFVQKKVEAKTSNQALFAQTIDASFVDQSLSDARKREIQDHASELNPQYDPEKLNGMLKWDISQFERLHLPAIIGELEGKAEYSVQRGLRVLDMAIRMPDQGWAIPAEFEQFSEALQMAVEHERSINPDYDESYYVYITVDQKRVLPNKSQRRHGYHSDAFVTGETNDAESGETILADNTYVMADQIPTEFQPGPFPFHEAGIDPEDCETVLRFFDDRSKGLEPVRFPAHTLLKMTPYDIHTPGMNDADEVIERTFIKIQFSKQRYNLIGNTINPNLNYDGWTWVPRNPNMRNHRNSIVDWNRPDKDLFLTIDSGDVDFTQNAPPALSWAKAHFTLAAKTEAVKAEPASAGDMLYTVHGNDVMTINIAQAGDMKITTSQGDQYFLSRSKFEKRYHPEPDANGYYKPKGNLQKMLEVTKPVKLKAPWGAWQYAPAGSMLTNIGGADTWLVHKENYKASYKLRRATGIWEPTPEGS